MKDKLKNITFLQSAKARVLVVIAVVVVAVVAIGLVWHNKSQFDLNHQGSASVASAPDIESIPGAGNPSNQYVKNQNLQNVQQAETARKNATSTVPTITRSSFMGSPQAFGELPKQSGSLSNKGLVDANCPILKDKSITMFKPNPASCTIQNLKLARQSGVTAEELRCQRCSCPALKLAGYTVGDLKGIGYTAKALRKCGFTLGQLVEAGYSAKDLKAAGYNAKQLAGVGFSPAQLASAGFTPDQIRKAGFSQTALSAAGMGDHQNAVAKNTSKACSVEQLKKARMNGASAVELKNKGCGLAALKAAGFTAAELKAAGFSAKQLKDAGFTAKQLKAAGFSAAALKKAGFDAKALKAAGYTAAALKAAGFNAGQLKAAGYSAKQLANAGFSAKQLRKAGYSAAALKNAGYTPRQLKAAGYTKGDLLRAGFSPVQAGYATKKVITVPAAKVRSAISRPSQPAVTSVDSPRAGLGGGASMPSIADNSPESRLAQFEKMQQAQMTAQQREDSIQRQQGAMMMEAQKMLAGWSNHGSQLMLKATPLPIANAGNGGVGVQGGANALPTGTTVKAGTILYAVLDTSVNSDEKTPIMATVVAGKLKGAKLLGQFARVNKKVLLKFNLLNMPHLSKTVTLNAVAIDPNTARTALSTSVNSHYLLRYGTLFASAFLEGVSHAILSSNSSTQCGIFGCVTHHEKLDTSKQVAVGLGTVGQRYAGVMGQNFDRAPTVKVRSGVGLGILLMSDLSLPVKLKQAAVNQ